MCHSFAKFISYAFLGVVCLFVTLEIIAYSGTIMECDDIIKIGPYRLTCCPDTNGGLKCTYETNKSTYETNKSRMEPIIKWIYWRFG